MAKIKKESLPTEPAEVEDQKVQTHAEQTSTMMLEARLEKLEARLNALCIDYNQKTGRQF
jgi:hypothetical protein